MIESTQTASITTNRRYTIWIAALLIVGVLAIAAVFKAWNGYHGTLDDEQQRLLRSDVLNADRLAASLTELRNNLIFFQRQATTAGATGGATLREMLSATKVFDEAVRGLALLDGAGNPQSVAFPDALSGAGVATGGFPPLPQRLRDRVAASAAPILETMPVFADMPSNDTPSNDKRGRLVTSILVVASPGKGQGQGQGMIAALLPANAFSRLSALLMPALDGSSVAIIDENNIIIGRYPDTALTVGRDVTDGPIMTSLRKTGLPETVSLTDSLVDTSTRAVAGRRFVRPGLPPLTLIVTRTVDEIITTWRHRAIGDAALFALTAAAILILAALAARREDALHHTAAAIAESSGIYLGLFEGSKAVKLLINPADGRIVDANNAACAFYGWTRAELRSLKISDINTLTEEDVQAELRAAQNENRNHFYFRHRLASGEIRDVEVHARPITYRDRHLLYSLVLDITDRRRLEQERQLLATAIEQSLASVIITDAAGNIQYVNPAFTAISGYSADEIVGQNPRILKSGHTTDEEYTEMWSTLTRGRSWSSMFLNRRKDGTTYWEHAQIAPVTDADGNITHYVGVKENVSELKEAEDWLLNANAKLSEQARQLQQANAELEQFAYVASHDLRQPLRAIASYMKLVERSVRGKINTEIDECLTFAVDGAQRMDALIVGLLEYSRVGRLNHPFAPVPLEDTVKLVMAGYALDTQEQGGTLTVTPGLPAVIGDSAELERLFSNLIGNAVKYRAEGRPPEIHVGWHRGPDAVTIWVKDNGIGIDPKDFGRAFGMFQRLVSRQQFEGTGIGLAVCKKIVEHHGGTIWIESEPGVGSTFLICFPAEKIVDNTA